MYPILGWCRIPYVIYFDLARSHVMSDHYPSTNISIKNLKSQNPQSQSTFSISYIVPLLTTVGVGLSLHTRRVCDCFNGQYWLGTNYWASGYSWTPAGRCQNRPQPHWCRGGSPCSWRRKLRRTGSSTVFLRQYFFSESFSEWSVMLSRMSGDSLRMTPVSSLIVNPPSWRP